MTHWFAERTDDNGAFPWQPTLAGDGTMFSLPVWFYTEDACDDFIRTIPSGGGISHQGGEVMGDLRDALIEALARNAMLNPASRRARGTADAVLATLVEHRDEVLALLGMERLPGHGDVPHADIDWSCAAHSEGQECCADRPGVYGAAELYKEGQS